MGDNDATAGASIPVRFPNRKITEEHVQDRLQCSVCLEYLCFGEIATFLQCEHVYHPSCAAALLKNKPECGMCRRSVSIRIRRLVKPYLQVEEVSNDPPPAPVEAGNEAEVGPPLRGRARQRRRATPRRRRTTPRRRVQLRGQSREEESGSLQERSRSPRRGRGRRPTPTRELRSRSSDTGPSVQPEQDPRALDVPSVGPNVGGGGARPDGSSQGEAPVDREAQPVSSVQPAVPAAARNEAPVLGGFERGLRQPGGTPEQQQPGPFDQFNFYRTMDEPPILVVIEGGRGPPDALPGAQEEESGGNVEYQRGLVRRVINTCQLM